jgi:hypothetical protein
MAPKPIDEATLAMDAFDLTLGLARRAAARAAAAIRISVVMRCSSIMVLSSFMLPLVFVVVGGEVCDWTPAAGVWAPLRCAIPPTRAPSNTSPNANSNNLRLPVVSHPMCVLLLQPFDTNALQPALLPILPSMRQK